MSELLSWDITHRNLFFREIWGDVGRRAAGRPIVIYGAGQHTLAMLGAVMDEPEGPSVSAIVDDNAGASIVPPEIKGIPVRRPCQTLLEDAAMVLVSSDSIEEQLAERAKTWAGGSRVVRIYGPEYRELLEAHRRRSKGLWGTAVTAQNGHLPMAPEEPVLRLRRVSHRKAGDSLPLPPPLLRAGYAPYDDAAYLQRGVNDVGAMRAMIAREAPEAGPIRRVLDWGCSSGRMIRHWGDVAAEGGEVWGCDICSESVNWASENLSPPFRFFQSTMRPSLPLGDGAMDLVYACSVFTHIRELYDTWLMELRRVVRPGGLVLTTILDERAWEGCRQNPLHKLRQRCVDLDFSGPLEDDFVCQGKAFDPLVFWHTEGVKRRWSFAFDVVAFEPELVAGQTGVLLRRPR